jgi:hypothetical protein
MTLVIKNKFHGGLPDDIRQETTIHAQHLSHFDAWSNPNRLTPRKIMTADHTPIGNNIRNFIFGSDNILYAVGINPSATTKMRLFSATWTTGGFATVATSATETIPTPSDKDGRNCLIEYKDYLWGVHGANLTKVWKYGPLSSSPTYTEAALTLANNYTQCGGAIVGEDDNLYIAMSSATRNDLIKIIPAGTQSIASITLPATEKVTCLAKYKGFLAIGVTNAAIGSNPVGIYSKIYLWDYVSSDVTEEFACPVGIITGLANVEGELMGVFYTFKLAGNATYTTIVSVWDGVKMKTIRKIPRVIPTLSRTQVYDGQLYFGGLSSGTGSTYEKTGVYAVGRATGNYEMGFNLAYQATASSDTSNPSAVHGFFIVDDFMYVSHGTDNVTKIVNSTAYSNTSIVETLINDSMPIADRRKLKQLVGIQVQTTPLPTAGQIVVKYKVDAESSFTTISTHTTDNSLSREDLNIVSTGKNLSQFYELTIRVESTGGAEITSINYLYEPIPTLLDKKAR